MRKGLLAPQNTFLDTIAERFDGQRKYKFCRKMYKFYPFSGIKKTCKKSTDLQKMRLIVYA